MTKPATLVGKPSNSYRATLRSIKKKDYDLLVHTCVTALINNEVSIMVAFTYTLVFPKGFPKGMLVSRGLDKSNVHKMKAKKLLTWLNENGHTLVTVEALGYQKRALSKFEVLFENKYDNLLLITENVEDLDYNSGMERYEDS